MNTLDTVVIGAGVVGLAIARAVAQAGREVIVLESESEFGAHASSRNSEVIHAGIYYTPGSRKARSCVAGKQQLYRYCEERQIEHQRIGKLLVAARANEKPRLQQLIDQAAACGVTDLRRLEATELAEREPELDVCAAVLSPSTGIVDSHQFMVSLLGDLEHAGGFLVLDSPVLSGALTEDGVELQIGGISASRSLCNTVINCAGLWAPDLAHALGLPREQLPTAYYARGHYYALAGRSPFRHLVYPMPSSAGLGVHVTVDLAGQARFGPDVEWIDGIDYAFNDNSEAQFRSAIAEYYPGISARDIHPSYTGIRAKIVAAGQPAADFTIDRSAFQHGKGLINLFGIESPGLTASMAIAEDVADMVKP